jgi:putative oxidoreductase
MFRVYPEFARGRAAVGLLLVRLSVGAAFLFHGWYKISAGATSWMPSGAPVPGFLQAAAAFTEFGGGLLLLLGLLTPVASLGLFFVMGVAINLAHLPARHPFVNPDPHGPSWELAAVYLAVALLALLAGPGKFSLDYLIFGPRANSTTGGQTF